MRLQTWLIAVLLTTMNLTVGTTAAQENAAVKAEFAAKLSELYEFYESQRSSTFSEQRTRTIYVPQRRTRIVTRLVPVLSTQTYSVWDGCKMVKMTRTVTAMESRQETRVSTTMVPQTETFTVTRTVVSGAPLNVRSLRMSGTIDLKALPAAAEPTLNRIRQAIRGSGTNLPNGRVTSAEVLLDSGWVNSSPYQKHLAVTAWPVNSTPANDVGLIVVAQNAAKGNTPPLPSDLVNATEEFEDEVRRRFANMKRSLTKVKP